jgi:hypothetical protein
MPRLHVLRKCNKRSKHMHGRTDHDGSKRMTGRSEGERMGEGRREEGIGLREGELQGGGRRN